MAFRLFYEFVECMWHRGIHNLYNKCNGLSQYKTRRASFLEELSNELVIEQIERRSTRGMSTQTIAVLNEVRDVLGDVEQPKPPQQSRDTTCVQKKLTEKPKPAARNV